MESTGMADLLEAVRQLIAFLDLSRTDALSPQGETTLNTATALAERAQGALDVPISVRSQVQQYVREAHLVIAELRILNSRRRSNRAVLARQLKLKEEAEGTQKQMEELVVELTTEESHVTSLEDQIARLQQDLADHKARAAAKTRALATSADKLEALVKDHTEAVQIDCVAEGAKLDAEDARLEIEWDRIKRGAEEFLNSHPQN
ncbi:hypothetical protein Dimus_039011 [Dionaea muscipula]